MKKITLITVLLFCGSASFSQSNKIVGSWIWRDSLNAIQFFIKANGTIEKRSSLANEYIWNKDPKKGTYTFNQDNRLLINWADKSIENGMVRFLDNFTAEIKFTGLKNKSIETHIFKKIVDEEVVPNK